LAAFVQLSISQIQAHLCSARFRQDARAASDRSGLAKGIETLATETQVVAVLSEQTCVEKLAQLFPSVSPVRIPVCVSTVATGRRRLEEETVIEFGTAREVLFSSILPLEFEDQVRLVNSDGSLDTRATVVAVRYHGGRKAVAVRFVGEVGNWIIKP
jgi:hypothetical protein